MAYHHLTQEERYQSYAFHKANFSIRQTATPLGRAPSTVSRELKRNINRRGYRPLMARQLAVARASQARFRVRITADQWHSIRRLLNLQWSPQQIGERARREGSLRISHTWIYHFVAGDRTCGGQLWRNLRRAGLRRRCYHRSHQRPGIRFPGGIEHRPPSVETRDQLGHWEGDTIVGHGLQGSVLTLVKRKSRYLRMGVLPDRKGRTVSRIMRYRLHQISAHALSITLDNGTEFARHPRMARPLSADIFFAEPYKSWQRGTNENTNGLIRQYLPKNRSLSDLTQIEADRIERRLNHRPRKCLGYLTPFEVFNDTQELLTVALRC